MTMSLSANVYVPDNRWELLFERVADHVHFSRHLMGVFKLQELSNIVWAYTKAGVHDIMPFGRVADHVVVGLWGDLLGSDHMTSVTWSRDFQRRRCWMPPSLMWWQSKWLILTTAAWKNSGPDHSKYISGILEGG